MSRNKLRYIQTIGELPNVVSTSAESNLAPNWLTRLFPKPQPIVLELGCGKGEFSLALARADSIHNYIGIDRKADRVWVGAQQALTEQLPNVGFVRSQIDLLPQLFPAETISELWITFPDPYLKPSKSSQRLTSPKFLEIYQKILVPNGKVHLKTDDATLFYFTLDNIKTLHAKNIVSSFDIDTDRIKDERVYIQSGYEQKHRAQAKNIHYISWTFSPLAP